MIRICRYLYINVLTVIFFCVCLATGKELFFLLSYSSMLLHELAHLLAAFFIGLRPLRITMHPFGVNLRLKSNFIYALSDEIILYLSGPLMNLIIALVVATVFKNEYAYSMNIALFTVNMLPIMPLDGGNLLKSIITYKVSEHTADIIMKILSAIFALIIFTAGIYAIRMTGYNYSVIFMSILIFANIFTSKEKYSKNTVKYLITPKKIDSKKINFYAVTNQSTPSQLAKSVHPSKYTCFIVIDKSGKPNRIITEHELSQMLKNGN